MKRNQPRNRSAVSVLRRAIGRVKNNYYCDQETERSLLAAGAEWRYPQGAAAELWLRGECVGSIDNGFFIHALGRGWSSRNETRPSTN